MFKKQFQRSLAAFMLFIMLFVGITPITNTAYAQANELKEFTKVKDSLKVHYIDVGQGDSILIELPDGKNALIDGGPTSSSQIVTNYLNSKNITKVDYLFATHPHEDHIGGLPTVINNFEIGNIYMPQVTHTTKAFENLLLTIQSKGKKITPVKANDTIFAYKGLILKAFGPTSPSSNNLNNASIVLKLHHADNGGAKNFLFTGDAEKEVEVGLINSGQDLNIDVLKVGHHGSNTSTTQEFLNATNPNYAVISCAKNNSYGHPHPEVISRLMAKDVKTFSTSESGHIIITSNGKDLTVETASGEVIKDIKPEPKPIVKPQPKPQPKPVIKPESKPTQTINKPKPQPVQKTPVGQKVMVTPTGKRYHARKCGRGNYSWSTLDKALKRGLTPCQKCY